MVRIEGVVVFIGVNLGRKLFSSSRQLAPSTHRADSSSPTPALAALLIVESSLRCRSAHFKLGTHVLDLSGLLLELGCECLCLLSNLL
jgi:hypothetical protein